jgi:hypothetical protein
VWTYYGKIGGDHSQLGGAVQEVIQNLDSQKNGF